MANLRTDYKDDVLDTSVNTKRKYNMITNADGTVSFEDVTEYAQVGDSYGSADINETNNHINELGEELKKSVSDGKTLVANAITEKRVETATDASFETMAENIGKIVLGSGNASAADVLVGKTFTNDDGVEYTGTMTNNGAVSKSITPSSSAQSYTIPAGYHNGSGKVNVSAISGSNVNITTGIEKTITVDTESSGTATVTTSLNANKTYILVTFYSFQGYNSSHIDVNCTVSSISASVTSGALTNVSNVNGCVSYAWRGYRVDKVVVGSSASTFTASATISGYYEKRLTLNTVKIELV